MSARTIVSHQDSFYGYNLKLVHNTTDSAKNLLQFCTKNMFDKLKQIDSIPVATNSPIFIVFEEFGEAKCLTGAYNIYYSIPMSRFKQVFMSGDSNEELCDIVSNMKNVHKEKDSNKISIECQGKIFYYYLDSYLVNDLIVFDSDGTILLATNDKYTENNWLRVYYEKN